MNNNYILEVSNLSKSYNDKKILKDISFNVNSGDIFGFLGPNGAGKTTTIRSMLGLIYPDYGTVTINGYNIKENFTKAIDKVGAVVESPQFYTYLTGYQNLSLIANLHPEISKDRIHEVLEIVRLKNRANDKVRTYSFGMKQRLGIARALINKPKLVILDEPTNGLDPHGIKEVRELISQLSLEQDITFFISTHLLYEVEQICNKVVILNEGQIITNGSVKELLDRNYEIVQIQTKDKDKTLEHLKSINYVKVLEVSNRNIKVKMKKGCSAKLNSFLLSKGITIEYLIPKNQTLEEYFIDVTKGGKEIA